MLGRWYRSLFQREARWRCYLCLVGRKELHSSVCRGGEVALPAGVTTLHTQCPEWGRLVWNGHGQCIAFASNNNT